MRVDRAVAVGVVGQEHRLAVSRRRLVVSLRCTVVAAAVAVEVDEEVVVGGIECAVGRVVLPLASAGRGATSA